MTQKTRVVGALAIAGVLIGGSYLLSSSIDPFAFLKSNVANAASTQAALEAYAQKEDGGVPDWKESLYGVDTPATTTDDASDLPGITAAPGSLTDQFAQSLLGNYLTQVAGTDPSDDDIDNFAVSQLQTAAQSQQHQDVYSAADIKTVGNGPDAMRAYAAAVGNILGNDNAATTDDAELDAFAALAENNDPSAVARMNEIANVYSSAALSLTQIPVPAEVEAAHLEFVNAMAKIALDIQDMAALNTDPLRASLGLNEYQNDVNSMGDALIDIDNVFQAENVTVASNSPGYDFYQLAASVGTPQQ